MQSRIPILILLALLGMGCSKSTPSATPTGTLAPQQVELKHIYASVTKRFELAFTVDGAPLTNATYTVDDVPTRLATLEVLPATPLGGGTWIEVTPVGVQGTFETRMQITTPEFNWSVPVLVEILPTPTCQAANECQFSMYDPVKDRCVTSNQTNGVVCTAQAVSCVQQSSCQQGVCVTKAVEELPPACAPNQPGAALVPVWSYRSNGQITFVGTTDEDGAIYFLDCIRKDGSKPSTDCDLVSLDASGVERWRTIGIMTSVTELNPPRLMVVGTTVFLAATAKSFGSSWIRIVDRATGVVRKQDDTLLQTLSAARLDAHNVAVIRNMSAVKLDLDTGMELLNLSLSNETIGAPLMSDGIDRLIGFSSQSLPPFMSPPLPPLHLFELCFAQSTPWMVELSRVSDVNLLANFGEQFLLTTPEIRSMTTGNVTLPIENTAHLFDAVLLPNALGLAVTDRALNGCQERLLQKIDMEFGVINWRCHLPTSVSTSQALSRLIALDNGGAIIAVETDSAATNATLLAIDGDRSAVLYDTLPLKLDFTTDVTPTMVGSRWVVSGVDPTTSREAIMAFDVPGLHAATSGWITSGGRLSRDWTPLLE